MKKEKKKIKSPMSANNRILQMGALLLIAYVIISDLQNRETTEDIWDIDPEKPIEEVANCGEKVTIKRSKVGDENILTETIVLGEGMIPIELEKGIDNMKKGEKKSLGEVEIELVDIVNNPVLKNTQNCKWVSSWE